MVILTQKVRIHPSPAQEKVLWELAETCRLLYNHALVDSDHNSAINIMLRFLSQYALWTGYQSFYQRIGNLRHTVNGQTKVPPAVSKLGFGDLVGNHLR